MPNLTWTPNPADGTLCANGYPIRIRKGGPFSYNLEVDGRTSAGSYHVLAYAKMDAERIAAELDEFES